MKKNKINKIVITGGAGYIGNELIKALPNSLEIVVIDNFCIDTKHKRIENKKLQKIKNLKIVQANVSEVNKYIKFLKNVDLVVYMASLNSYKESNDNPIMYLNENNINLQLFVNALKKSSPKVKKILLTSTRGVYGEGPYKCLKCKTRMYPYLSENIKCTICSSKSVSPVKIKESDLENPSSYYGVTKKIQEDLLKAFCVQNNIELDIFRIFNVYGEDQGKYYSHIGIIPQIYEQITKNKQMYLSGNGNVARDFIYVGDLIEIFLKSIHFKNKKENLVEIYNLGSGLPVTISDISNFFASMGYKFKTNKIKEYGDIKYSIADNLKASKVFKVAKFKNIYDFIEKSYERMK